MMPVEDTKEAQWVINSIEKPWSRSKNANYVASIIPHGFAAYARLFHPAYLGTEDMGITWSEVAKHTGRTPHSQMQWHLITGLKDSKMHVDGLVTPSTGHLPERQVKALIEILYNYTNTPENCYFAIWDGWGYPSVKNLQNQTATFQLSDRCYYLLKGDIHAAITGISSFLIPSIWWPQDCTWCVATEVDMMWTYVGAAKDCIDDIIRDDRLEAWLATPDDRADVYGDDINNE